MHLLFEKGRVPQTFAFLLWYNERLLAGFFFLAFKPECIFRYFDIWKYIVWSVQQQRRLYYPESLDTSRKVFIYKCKLNKIKPILTILLAKTKTVYYIEKKIATKNNQLYKHYKKWEKLIPSLNNRWAQFVISLSQHVTNFLFFCIWVAALL